MVTLDGIKRTHQQSNENLLRFNLIIQFLDALVNSSRIIVRKIERMMKGIS